MNIEETVENLKKYISFSEKECNFPSIYDWNWHKDLANDIETLLTAYEKEKEKNNNVLGLIFEYGQTDGEHHKAWVIDQIVRIMTENNYDKWVQHYEYDEETDEDYFWDIGIAP